MDGLVSYIRMWMEGNQNMKSESTPASGGAVAVVARGLEAGESVSQEEVMALLHMRLQKTLNAQKDLLRRTRLRPVTKLTDTSVGESRQGAC